jgi:cytochrome P450
VIKATATSLYAGASDTTVSAMRSFFLAMTIHPEFQVKAQEEIDTVIGTHRLPTINDREEMPFCDRLVKEVLRWGVIGPLGIPHVSKVDDEYNGYFIPKGTVIVGNIW